MKTMREIMKLFEAAPSSSSSGLQDLLNFMVAIKNGDKSNDIKSRERILKTSHNLRLISTEVEYGWLVHFTEDSNGLKSTPMQGVADFRQLGQTRGMARGGRTNEGFNYAFPVPSKEASYESSRSPTSGMDPYGGDAFIFQAPYIRVYHTGDKQVQAIFQSSSFKAAEAIHLQAETNFDQYRARSRIYRYENQSINAPNPISYSPAEWQELRRQARQPSVLWNVLTGPRTGVKGGWAKVIKAVLS